MSRHARTFNFAARFLPPAQRRSVQVLYAFFRSLDDLVDGELDRDTVQRELEVWRDWFEGGMVGYSPQPRLAHEVASIVRRYDISTGVMLHFLDGMDSDLVDRRRIANLEELERYCYQVAGTVGVAMCGVLEVHDRPAFGAAIDLGIAMQMTNIVRDVGGDLRLGRIYLPQDELRQAGLSDAELIDLARPGGPVDPRFRRLMKQQVMRADSYYASGLRGVMLLPDGARLPILVAGKLYQRILRDLERADYDSLHRRASTTGWEKVREAVVCYARLRAAPIIRRLAAARGHKRQATSDEPETAQW
jgi:15-cis-phytoene synthase